MTKEQSSFWLQIIVCAQEVFIRKLIWFNGVLAFLSVIVFKTQISEYLQKKQPGGKLKKTTEKANCWPIKLIIYTNNVIEGIMLSQTGNTYTVFHLHVSM